MQVEAAVNTGVAVAVDNIKAVVDSIRAEVVVPARKSAGATFLIGVLDHLAAQFKDNAGTLAAAVLVASKRVHRIATSKAIPRPLTSILTAISGSVMTGAAT